MWWGYSRQIWADEGGTLQALKIIRAQLFEPTIAERSGRLRQVSRFEHREGCIPGRHPRGVLAAIPV
jgi:hypothetical protein